MLVLRCVHNTGGGHSNEEQRGASCDGHRAGVQRGPSSGQRAQRFLVAVDTGVLDPEAMELIVVDDGSTDETGRRAEELLGDTFSRFRVLRIHDNAGKGAAVRRDGGCFFTP